MRRRKPPEAMAPELQLAIGLVWGHLNAYQYEPAYELALGCLQLWPQSAQLQLMCDYAAAELMEPVDVARLRSLRGADDGAHAAWVDLVLRRLQQHPHASLHANLQAPQIPPTSSSRGTP